MPMLILERQTSFGLPVVDVAIILDGRECGSIGRALKVEFSIHPGPHALQARMGSVTSQPVYFRADDRETVGFSCIVSGIWQRRLTLQRIFHRQPENRFTRKSVSGDSLSPEDVSSHFRGDAADWHLVLNVADTASSEEVRRAYLNMIRRFHPDQLARLHGLEKQKAENAARVVNNAYAEAKKKHRLP